MAAFSLLFAFLLTVLVECGLSLIFRSKRLIYCVFLCNLLTNPLLNLLILLVYTFFGLTFYRSAVVILEVAVVFAEAWIIALMMGYRYRKSWLLSLLFNGASFSAGLILQILGVF